MDLPASLLPCSGDVYPLSWVGLEPSIRRSHSVLSKLVIDSWPIAGRHKKKVAKQSA